MLTICTFSCEIVLFAYFIDICSKRLYLTNKKAFYAHDWRSSLHRYFIWRHQWKIVIQVGFQMCILLRKKIYVIENVCTPPYTIIDADPILEILINLFSKLKHFHCLSIYYNSIEFRIEFKWCHVNKNHANWKFINRKLAGTPIPRGVLFHSFIDKKQNTRFKNILI